MLKLFKIFILLLSFYLYNLYRKVYPSISTRKDNIYILIASSTRKTDWYTVSFDPRQHYCRVEESITLARSESEITCFFKYYSFPSDLRNQPKEIQWNIIIIKFHNYLKKCDSKFTKLTIKTTYNFSIPKKNHMQRTCLVSHFLWKDYGTPHRRNFESREDS